MNTIELILKARAAADGRVHARRLLRHVRVERAPLAIAALQMAGEPYALWAALVGNDPERPQLIVAPEPRNRDIAFAALAEFAEVICGAFDGAALAPRVQVQRKSGESSWRCSTAPQILVANRAVVDLLERLGRRMRTAGFGGHVHVPPSTNTAGGHLGFIAEAARQPGSALTLVATEQLGRHAVTGQSAFEDAHLGAQLGWWNPAYAERIAPGCLGGADPATTHGADCARAIEGVAMGVLTDPRQDNGQLLDAVTRFNRLRERATDAATITRLGTELRDLLQRALLPTWRALWIAHDVLSWLPPADGSVRRWVDDLALFTRHADYIAEGGRRAAVDSARRAAMLLADWERAQAALERDEVLEDPLALAAALAQGHAIAGTVVDLDLDNREASGSGKRTVVRPLIELDCEDPCPSRLGPNCGGQSVLARFGCKSSRRSRGGWAAQLF